MPTIRNSCRRPDRRNADPVAELELLVVRDALVDGDLLAAAGPTALDEVERVEALVLRRRLDAERERRRNPFCRSPRRPAAAASSGSPDTEPAATSTPSTARTLSSVASGIGGASADSPSKLKPGSLPVTTASVPAYESTKIASNALSIVSVSTYAPLIIATPSTIASAVSAVRSLRPARLFSAKRITRQSYSNAAARAAG